MLQEILEELSPKGVKLVAVSKSQSAEAIMGLYDEGHHIFGENRVQELVPKHEALPKDIEWHLVGHLQTNKVKYIAPFIACVHSVDSLKLLLEIDKQAKKYGRVIDCLLQFYIATEETKFGLSLEEAQEILKAPEYNNVNNARVTGVMGMASFSDNMTLVRKEFRQLKSIFDELKVKYFHEREYFKEISMGMSGDYRIAVEEGSTLVRIGTLLFSDRNT